MTRVASGNAMRDFCRRSDRKHGKSGGKYPPDALYFSRSPIPYPRNAEKALPGNTFGIYAYRRDVLQNHSQLPESMQEQAESLSSCADERGDQHPYI